MRFVHRTARTNRHYSRTGIVRVRWSVRIVQAKSRFKSDCSIHFVLYDIYRTVLYTSDGPISIEPAILYDTYRTVRRYRVVRCLSYGHRTVRWVSSCTTVIVRSISTIITVRSSDGYRTYIVRVRCLFDYNVDYYRTGTIYIVCSSFSYRTGIVQASYRHRTGIVSVYCLNMCYNYTGEHWWMDFTFTHLGHSLQLAEPGI
jgi:hypothetical protein